MSCKVSLEKLEDTMKQLVEQQTGLANDIKLKDLDLSQTKESYLKVLGAIEIVCCSVNCFNVSSNFSKETLQDIVNILLI